MPVHRPAFVDTVWRLTTLPGVEQALLRRQTPTRGSRLGHETRHQVRNGRSPSERECRILVRRGEFNRPESPDPTYNRGKRTNTIGALLSQRLRQEQQRDEWGSARVDSGHAFTKTAHRCTPRP
jgi:hypothetical protein